VPALDLIMGGHEHENWYLQRGAGMAPIAKADANVRTVYLHHLRFNPETDALSIRSRLFPITDVLPDDPATAQVVDEWVGIAFEGFRRQGLKPAEPVVTLPEALDGRESTVRNTSSTLTDLMAEAMLRAAPGAALSLFNGGSIRIDDVVQPGTLIEYDVIRILPFGGEVLGVDMKGSLLDSVLTQGVANRGTGGFLHHAGVEQQGGAWHVGGRPIDPARAYRVAINDFLTLGLEQNLDYLTFDNPGLARVGAHGDVRLVVIAELKRRFGG
jgi:5'-nucleotidase